MGDVIISWNDQEKISHRYKSYKLMIIGKYDYHNRVLFYENNNNSAVYMFKVLSGTGCKRAKVYDASISKVLKYGAMLSSLRKLLDDDIDNDKWTSPTIYVDVTLNVISFSPSSIMDKSIYHCANVSELINTVGCLFREKLSNNYENMIGIYCKLHNKNYTMLYCSKFYDKKGIIEGCRNLLSFCNKRRINEIETITKHVDVKYYVRVYTYHIANVA